jgi:hypothetical protein
MIIYDLVIGEPVLTVLMPMLLKSKLFKSQGSEEPNCDSLSSSSTAQQHTSNVSLELLAFRNKASPVAIATTCRQFYHEAIKVWYENTRFMFDDLRHMRLFERTIGALNRDMIRHIGYFAPSEQSLHVCRAFMFMASTFAGLRNLTFVVVRGKTGFQTPWMDMEKFERLLKIWKGDVDNPLRLGDRLESVIFTTRLVKGGQLINGNSQMTWAEESRELKLKNCTGEYAATNSMV